MLELLVAVPREILNEFGHFGFSADGTSSASNDPLAGSALLKLSWRTELPSKRDEEDT